MQMGVHARITQVQALNDEVIPYSYYVCSFFSRIGLQWIANPQLGAPAVAYIECAMNNSYKGWCNCYI